MAISGELYIAGPFGDREIQGITEHFERLFGEPVALDVQRDDSLIGGFLALIGGKVYDSSLRARVQEMKRHMLEKERPIS
ncbi:MAG: F0F1 ATP synthase subunit delta [Bacillota bacterium]